jgi:enoyl-CoA hydratase/carnithine racemase
VSVEQAREALALGLVDSSGESLMAEAEATARKFAAGAPRAYGIKQTMARARTRSL